MGSRFVLRAGAVALALAAVSCKSDKSTGPGSTNYAGSYTGIIAGATTSGTLTITIPSGSPAAPARALGTPSSASYSIDGVDATVVVTGTLKIAGGSTYPITAGSFDNVSGVLTGVIAGPYAISGKFGSGVFSGLWTNTGAGTSGGFSLLLAPATGSNLALCGLYIGAASGVWNVSLPPASGVFVGQAANGSSRFSLTGQFTATGSGGAMLNIISPDDATVHASGTLTGTTASGIWSGGGGSGTWSGSSAACN
jgi:hypothetical protein